MKLKIHLKKHLMIGLAFFIVLMTFVPPIPVRADGTITVTTNADNSVIDGSCSLREALTNANNDTSINVDCAAGTANDTIIFDDELGNSTITLNSALPPISDLDGLSIDGEKRISISGNTVLRVFYVNSGASLILDNIAILNGNAFGDKGGAIYNNGGILTIRNSLFANSQSSFGGGAVYNSSEGTLNVMGSTFTDNSTAGGGGGIATNGPMSVANSTFYSNHANDGGGIFVYGFPNYLGYRTVTNSTISDNTGVNGGGLWVEGNLWLYNSIVANNLAGFSNDCYLLNSNSGVIGNNNLIESSGINACNLTNGSNSNIVGVDPKLSGNLFGWPGVLALLSGSSAINKGNNSICSDEPVNNSSQNEVIRPQSSACDIGAYEYSNVDTRSPSVTSITRANTNPTVAENVNFIVTFSESVVGLDTNDFLLDTNGVIGASITGMSGSGTTYAVTVNTGTGDGTIHLDLIDNDSIMDASLSPLGNAGVGNGDFTTGETYTIDKTPPTVLSITPSTNPSSQVSTPEVQFKVTFSENVLNLDPSDFNLLSTDIYGAGITSITGLGPTYTVNVSTGVGDGTINLELLDDDNITDAALNPLGGLGAGNGDFAGTSPYTIKKPKLSAPVLRSPKANSVLNNVIPTFWWSGNAGYPSFEIQVASDSKFITVIETQVVNGTSHTISTPLTEGRYFWRVRVLLPSLQTSKWSNTAVVNIDLTPPPVPQLTSPSNSSTSSRKPVTFKWRNVKDAITYEFRYDNNSDCGSPEYTSVGRSTSITFPTMSNGVYYWCIRAKDSAGNWSALSSPFMVTITGH